MRFLLVCFVLSAGLAAPSFAGGVLYDCDLPRTSSGKGWVSQKVAITVQSGGRVNVSDGHILGIHGKPIPVKSAKDSAAALVVRWSLKGLKDRDNRYPPSLSYRAKINKKTGVISVSARPSDSPQNFTERGKCATRVTK